MPTRFFERIPEAGYIESDYLPTVKADGNYFFVRSTFALDLANKKPLVGQVAELYQKKYNIPMGENTARSFSAPFVLADAFNRAKSTVHLPVHHQQGDEGPRAGPVGGDLRR